MNTSVDPNCFMTVGKGMMHGVVPYRDLLKQKGPVLYFVYGLAALVSPHSFFSVYLLELIADTIALYVMSMCADLHSKNGSQR